MRARVLDGVTYVALPDVVDQLRRRASACRIAGEVAIAVECRAQADQLDCALMALDED